MYSARSFCLFLGSLLNRTAGYKHFHSICKKDRYKEVCTRHFLRFCLFLQIHMFSLYKIIIWKAQGVPQ